MQSNRIKKVIIISAAVLLVMITAVIIFISLKNSDEKDDYLDMLFSGSQVIIPWNPGGTADLVTRTVIDLTFQEMNVKNIHGANGTLGLNEVLALPHDGEAVLGTNISAFVTAQQMGFTDVSYKDWAVWITAFSPSIIAVKADSEYKDFDSIIDFAENNPNKLVFANAGIGTLSFISANLVADKLDINIKHEAYSGLNPAVNAVLSGEADIITALSSELIDKLQSGELVAIAVLDDKPLTLQGLDYEISAINSFTSFGEFYGMMIPSDVPEEVLDDYDLRLSRTVDSKEFESFTKSKGLVSFQLNHSESAEISDRIASLVCWTLYDTNCVSANPEQFGIFRA